MKLGEMRLGEIKIGKMRLGEMLLNRVDGGVLAESEFWCIFDLIKNTSGRTTLPSTSSPKVATPLRNVILYALSVALNGRRHTCIHLSPC